MIYSNGAAIISVTFLWTFFSARCIYSWWLRHRRNSFSAADSIELAEFEFMLIGECKARKKINITKLLITLCCVRVCALPLTKWLPLAQCSISHCSLLNVCLWRRENPTLQTIKIPQMQAELHNNGINACFTL